MSPSISIQTPHHLLALPPLLDPINGRFHVGEVNAFSEGSRKRKRRPELAVGIDGEGINLYNVLSADFITSYALPPRSTFTCPPCSYRRNGSKGNSTHRVTYASVSGSKRQIVGFHDTSAKSRSRLSPSTASSSAKYSYETLPSSQPVKFIQVLPHHAVQGSGATLADILTVQADGTARCLSGDLKEEKWQVGPQSWSEAGGKEASVAAIKVEHAVLTDVQAASQGLLKRRDDVLAVLGVEAGIGLEAHQADPLLILLGKLKRKSKVAMRRLYVLAVRQHRRGGFANTSSGSLQKVLVLDLPESHGKLSEISPVDFQASAGVLRVVLNDSLVSYDLYGATPTISSRVPIGNGSTSSCLNLNGPIFLRADSTVVEVLDQRHKSIVTSCAIPEKAMTIPESKKRKYADVEPQKGRSVIKFLSYFPGSGLAVGIVAHQLIGVHVTSTLQPPGSGRPLLGATLLDAVGHGIDSDSGPLRMPQSQGKDSLLLEYVPCSRVNTRKSWLKTVSKLDSHASRGRVESFERVMAKWLGIPRDDAALLNWEKRREEERRISKLESENGLAESLPNGIGPTDTLMSEGRDEEEAPPLPEWKWTAKKQNDHNHGTSWFHDEILYILGVMFTISRDEVSQSRQLASTSEKTQTSLSLKFLPPNVFQWLLDSRGLSTDNIQRALRDKSPEIPALKNCELIHSLVAYDPTLEILLSVLQSPTYLHPVEIVEALRVAIQSLEYPGAAEPPTLRLLNGPPDSALTNGELDSAMELEESAAELELQLAENLLDTDSQVRERVLFLALNKLNAYAPPIITATLKQAMTTAELTALINLLRAELANTGWLSDLFSEDVAEPEPSNPQDTNDPSGAPPDNHSILLISNLLNTALDALGPTAWLSATTSSPSFPLDTASSPPAELVPALKSEISAALEGIQEATYLSSLVGEVLRYGRSTSSASSAQIAAGSNAEQQQDQAQEESKWGGVIQTLPATSSGEDERRLLPLGLKAGGEGGGIGSGGAVEISRTRVGAGGEVKVRSSRDVGRLKSMQVGEYTLERIVI